MVVVVVVLAETKARGPAQLQQADDCETHFGAHFGTDFEAHFGADFEGDSEQVSVVAAHVVVVVVHFHRHCCCCCCCWC